MYCEQHYKTCCNYFNDIYLRMLDNIYTYCDIVTLNSNECTSTANVKIHSLLQKIYKKICVQLSVRHTVLLTEKIDRVTVLPWKNRLLSLALLSCKLLNSCYKTSCFLKEKKM